MIALKLSLLPTGCPIYRA